MFDGFVESMTKLPVLARFAIGLAIILLVPPLCKRVRLPAVVGLVLAGVLVGPSGLHIAPKHGEVAALFSDVGKLLLMFFAGLEIDLNQFNRSRNRPPGLRIGHFCDSSRRRIRRGSWFWLRLDLGTLDRIVISLTYSTWLSPSSNAWGSFAIKP